MFIKFLYKSYRFFFATKVWRKRKFSGAGLLMLGTVGAAALLGLDTKLSTVYQIFTFVAPLLAISALFSLFFRARFTVNRSLPRFASVGEKVVYRIRVGNLTGKTQKGLYLLENPGDPRPTFDEFVKAREPGGERRNAWDRKILFHRWLWLVHIKKKVQTGELALPTISPGAEAEANVELKPLRRGRLDLNGVSIARPDPFGLTRSLAFVPNKQSLLILPKRYRLPPIRLPGSRKHHSGGVALTSSVGNSDEFINLRDYRPGDPMRLIHWKSWAKTGDLIIKEHQDEFFVRHALILDTFQKRPHGEIFEEAVSVAASFVCAMETRETLLDLMFVGARAYCFTSGRGMGNTDKMLEILACVNACEDKPFSTLPPSVLNHAPLLSGCILVLLTWDDERRRLVGSLRALGIPMIVLVIAAPSSPDDPGPMREDEDDFHMLKVGEIEEGLAAL
ncbi:MAG: DUF58 domain-containing protein [Desulfobacterales bacterium]|nr:DUF58 domain-containing protein [Desulfobacterales bacterium]